MPTMIRHGYTLFTTPSDREIACTHIVEAPRALVFDMHLRPELVRQWMLGPEGWSMPVCEIDARPGGAWRYVWRRDNGSEMGMTGEFREIVRPTRLVYTEAWGGEWPETLNTVVFTEDAGRTSIITRVRYPTRRARDAVWGSGMEEGWARSYDRLDEMVKSEL